MRCDAMRCDAMRCDAMRCEAKRSEAKRSEKLKKGRISGSTVTPTYRSFRRCELDTVASSARRIFLCEGVVQGRSRSGSCARQCENSRKGKKRRITESAVTPSYGGFRRYELDTGGGGSARRIFLCENGIVQGRSRSGAWHIHC